MSDEAGRVGGSAEEIPRPDYPEKPKSKPGAKPRASRAGTRSVATLNAEQLTRKRANDREAQRAIRQRTREHVERLEKRIKELSGDPGSDPALEEVQRRNSELEEELRLLRETLYGSEDGTSSPELTFSNSGYGTASAGEPSSLPYPAPWVTQNVHVGPLAFAPTSAPALRPEVSWASRVASHEGNLGSNAHPEFGQAGPSSGRASFDSGFDSTFVSEEGAGLAGHMIPSHPDHLQSFNANPASQVGRQIPFRGGRPENSWPAPSSVPTMGGSFGGTEFPPVSTLSDPTTHGMNSVFINQPSLQVWEFPLRISHPASLVASLMIDVLHKQRRLRTEGVTGTALTGPSQPTLRALLQPENSSPVHPLTRTISEMMRAINFRGFAERIGTMFVIYPVFRWLVVHSYETYTGLPEFYIPLESQLNTPHPIWISLIGWPRLREAVIANQEKYANPEFEYLYGSSVNVNWPYRPQDVLEQVGEDWRPTEQFKRHVLTLENWSLDKPFQRKYPELRNVCRFTEYPPGDLDLSTSNP